jgi:hypothetical protein
MQCQSCNAEINPQWKHALDKNICPMCGAAIMEEHLKNLFTTLRSTMDGLEKYQSQLDDWMLSNHQYVKTYSPNLMKFIPKEELDRLTHITMVSSKKPDNHEKNMVKVQTDKGEEEVEVQHVQSQEKTNEFFQRANKGKIKKDNLSTVERTQKLKDTVSKMNKAGISFVPQDGNEEDENSDMNYNNTQQYSSEEVDPSEYQAMVNQQTGNQFTSAFAGAQDGEDLIPASVLAMAQGAGSNSKSQKDLASLQAMVNKSKNMGAGGFSRG